MENIPVIITVLALLGGILIFAEFFVPGGVMGVIGAVCLVVMVALVFGNYGAFWGSVALGGAAITGILYMVLFLLIFPKTYMARRLALHSEVQGKSVDVPDSVAWVGQHGEAATPLRPAGKAIFGTERMEVEAESGLIPSGHKVQVVRVAGSRLIVRAV